MTRKISEIDLGTTGLPSLDKRASNKIGGQHGETGSVATLTDLSARSPGDNDETLLAILKSRLPGQLTRDEATVFRADGQFGGTEVRGYRIERDAQAEAFDIIEQFFQPAAPEEIAKAFAVMKVSTASRERDEIDKKLQTDVYCQAMMRYPADVALAVLGKARHWFPTIAELAADAEKMMETREKLRKAIW